MWRHLRLPIVCRVEFPDPRGQQTPAEYRLILPSVADFVLAAMLRVGQFNNLAVIKEVDFGFYLDSEDDRWGETLLPYNQAPKGLLVPFGQQMIRLQANRCEPRVGWGAIGSVALNQRGSSNRESESFPATQRGPIVTPNGSHRPPDSLSETREPGRPNENRPTRCQKCGYRKNPEALAPGPHR